MGGRGSEAGWEGEGLWRISSGGGGWGAGEDRWDVWRGGVGPRGGRWGGGVGGRRVGVEGMLGSWGVGERACGVGRKDVGVWGGKWMGGEGGEDVGC